MFEDAEVLDMFTHKNKLCKVLLFKNGAEYTVRVYDHDGQPVNGYSYSVTSDILFDMKLKGITYDAFKDFAETAKTDVIEGKYEKYLEILSRYQ